MESVEKYLISKCPQLVARLRAERVVVKPREAEMSTGSDQSLRCLHRIGRGGSGFVFEVSIKEESDLQKDVCHQLR